MESRAFLLAPTKRQTLPISRNVAFAELKKDASVKPECSIRRTETLRRTKTTPNQG